MNYCSKIPEDLTRKKERLVKQRPLVVNVNPYVNTESIMIQLTEQDVQNSLIPLPYELWGQANVFKRLQDPRNLQLLIPIRWTPNGFICPQIFQSGEDSLRAGAKIRIDVDPNQECLQLSVFINPRPNHGNPHGGGHQIIGPRRQGGPINARDYEIPEQADPYFDKVLNQFIATVERANGGWASKLKSYQYARMDVPSLEHMHHFWSRTAIDFKTLCQTANPNWDDTVHRKNLELFAEDICIWGGVPQKQGYADAWKVAKAAVTGHVDPDAPMSSGWTKVAAFASDTLTHEQTIWDSRVSVSVIGGIKNALAQVELDRSQILEHVPWLEKVRIVSAQADGRRERIEELKNSGWSVGMCNWPSHFGGSSIVRRIVKLMIAKPIRFPDELTPNFGENWNMFNVGMALFMDGK